MEVNMNIFSRAMRTIAGGMQYPVIILLILLIAVSLFMIGWIISEYFTERKHLKVEMPKMVDAINCTGNTAEIVDCISECELLKRQKAALIELTAHPSITPLMRESLAVRLVQQEQSFYDRRVKITDIIAKIAPMLGLLGTLIPLGPGIIALGQGDTITLSSSLLTAFDTTILGLISAAVAMVISTIRGRWYDNYMSILETLMECILEVEKRDVKA
ncbi:MAG: MotA/TolQ/ExbB proton channel family protein [Mogibacterium sp.]|nr:MotA/TolQ/ExbB proton channel family protein [Candidatus Crickella caballi]MCQ2566851.1 MotA/TolQ/ExbB proton channel family protein [Mogibacterium sp.]